MSLARRPADVDPLLGGLSPAAFLRAHWQKKPLLVRQAITSILLNDKGGMR